MATNTEYTFIGNTPLNTTTNEIIQSSSELGFPRERAQVADSTVQDPSVQAALDWLLQEDSPAPAETAKSLQCLDCGVLLRDADHAQSHALKTTHTNFQESTEAVQPLTKEEKERRLEMLKQKLVEKRAQKQSEEAENQKSKELLRRRTGQEIAAAKEQIEQLAMKRAFDAKRREKEEDRLAKERVRAQLEADKKERMERANAKKNVASTTSTTSGPSTATTTTAAFTSNDARIQIKTPHGTITHTFTATDTLSSIYEYMLKELPNCIGLSLWQAFPRKQLNVIQDGSVSLKDLGLVPSAALVAQ